MLQIATGKLFERAVLRENHLRGTLYTNAVIGYEEIVDTVIGKMLPSAGTTTRPQVVVYEFTERIQAAARGPEILVSSGVDAYLPDVAVVVAFGLNCVCTPDIDLCRRLTNGQRGISTRAAPNTLVKRFFEREIWCQQKDREFLTAFIAKLIGLPRRTFLGVMRSLRTYVSGMYRIADDLELAYALLVASVESLAQDFDGHESDWESLDERKRAAIDEALGNADLAVAQRVRDALLRVEHVALARRFREFVVAHAMAEHFRPTPNADGPALARSDLQGAVGRAYQSRSKYLHQLMELPDVVTLPNRFVETVIEDRATHLTLQGLARLMRAVIIEFVMRQPVVRHQPYDFSLEVSGVVQVRLAAQYWVGRTEGDLSRAGRAKLEGFLEQLTACLTEERGAALTDLRPVLALAAEHVPTWERRHRLPYLALHVAFNEYVGHGNSAPIPTAVENLIRLELAEPSSEALLAHTLTDQVVPWPLERHVGAVEDYLRRRDTKNGLRFPRLIEAALFLDLAERHRVAGEIERCQATVARAVENHPGHAGLQQLEREFEQRVPINWRNTLLARVGPAAAAER